MYSGSAIMFQRWMTVEQASSAIYMFETWTTVELDNFWSMHTNISACVKSELSVEQDRADDNLSLHTIYNSFYFQVVS